MIGDVAEVNIGAPPRFGAMTRNGKGEAVGGITLMLKGGNSAQVINEVKERMKSEKYGHLTILAIAYDSGFNSKSTFNSVFRKHKGVTPSQFMSSYLKEAS